MLFSYLDIIFKLGLLFQGLGGGKFSELTPHQRAALYWPGIQGNTV